MPIESSEAWRSSKCYIIFFIAKCTWKNLHLTFICFLTEANDSKLSWVDSQLGCKILMEWGEVCRETSWKSFCINLLFHRLQMVQMTGARSIHMETFTSLSIFMINQETYSAAVIYTIWKKKGGSRTKVVRERERYREREAYISSRITGSSWWSSGVGTGFLSALTMSCKIRSLHQNWSNKPP